MMKKEKEVYVGALYTQVELIDWQSILKMVEKEVKVDLEIRIGNGLIRDVKSIFNQNLKIEETKSIIIDNECCGIYSDNENFLSEKFIQSPITMEYFQIPFYEKSKEGISLYPKFMVNIDFELIEKSLTKKKVSLYEYMGNRYAYNPRVSSNEYSLLQHIYHKNNYVEDENGSKILFNEVREIVK